MQPNANREVPTLRLYFETDSFIPATDVAAVLKEIATAFERYVKRHRQWAPLRLAIKRVEVSSLSADFIVIGVTAAQMAIEHREALYGFVGFVADTFSIAQGVKSGRPKAADVRMVDALQKPVAEGRAQQVNVFVVGDSNNVTIDKNAIQLIQTHRERSWVTKAYRLPDPNSGEDFELRATTPQILTLEGKFGTVFDVKGQWYVRLEGEGGVLNPLQLEQGVVVEDGIPYLFDGVWDHRHYRIHAARPLR